MVDRAKSRRSGRFVSDCLMGDSRPRMIDLFACGWLMLVRGGVCPVCDAAQMRS
jgi:hypothetical protein